MNRHCYECLIVQSPHMHHCRICENCIDFHHKHSDFIGKCIGRDNAIAYYWFLVTNTVLNAMFVYCFISCIAAPKEGEEAPSNFILMIVGCFTNIWEESRFFIGFAFLVTGYMMLADFDKLV